VVESQRDALAAQVSAVRAEREWRPIATCPEAEDVLLFSRDAAEWARVMIGHRVTDDDEVGARWFYSQDVDADGSPWDVDPTHWMPLPLAPASAAPEGDPT
jgi:hypothetical protein